jgi:hypothetical protein
LPVRQHVNHVNLVVAAGALDSSGRLLRPPLGTSYMLNGASSSIGHGVEALTLRIVMLPKRSTVCLTSNHNNVSLPSQVVSFALGPPRSRRYHMFAKAMTGALLVKYTGRDTDLSRRVLFSATLVLVGIHTVATIGHPKRNGIQKDPRRVGKLVGDTTNNMTTSG